MKGHNMKAAKEKKMDRKRKHKALAVVKTEKSRQRRLDNKAKRDEIHAVDSNIKIIIKNQVTYDDLGTEIMVENGKIKTVSKDFDQKLQDKIDVIEEVEVNNNIIETLAKKWRL